MRKLAALVFCLLCAQGTVFAQQKQSVINSAVVDQESGLVLVTGQFSYVPQVTIDGMLVNVVSASSRMLVVELPASLVAQPGTYQLTVVSGFGARGTSSFAIAVGAIGPQGPRGDNGARGEAGSQGPQGLQGPAGAPGKDGLNGKDGANGHDGLNGKDGAPGLTGLSGKDGKDGVKGDRGPSGPAALTVVDAAGTELGVFVAPSSAIREINGTWVQLPLSDGALTNCSAGCLLLMYAGAGCTGDVYVQASRGLIQTAMVMDDTVMYPAGPPSDKSVQSYRMNGYPCADLGGVSMQQAADGKSVPMSSLGVTGALHLSR